MIISYTIWCIKELSLKTFALYQMKGKHATSYKCDEHSYTHVQPTHKHFYTVLHLHSKTQIYIYIYIASGSIHHQSISCATLTCRQFVPIAHLMCIINKFYNIGIGYIKHNNELHITRVKYLYDLARTLMSNAPPNHCRWKILISCVFGGENGSWYFDT